MSLLDDARKIMNAGPATYGEWECVLCHRDGKDRLTHTDDCPWLAMPRIVQVLTDARQLADYLNLTAAEYAAKYGKDDDWWTDWPDKPFVQRIVAAMGDAP